MDLRVDTDTARTGRTMNRDVARIIDDEAGVVLYLFEGKNGIGTVPISETDL